MIGEVLGHYRIVQALVIIALLCPLQSRDDTQRYEYHVYSNRSDSVLFLHGYPQTHVCWHRVAPQAENVQGVALDCGHFLPEQDSKRTADELIRFLT